MNQGHRFMLEMPCSHQVAAVAGDGRWNERLKRPKTTLQQQRLTR